MKTLTSKIGMVMVAFGIMIGTLSAAPSIASADTFFACTVVNVFEYSNRVHARCSNSITLNGNTVRYIAISNSDGNKAARFTAQATSAFLSGKKFIADLPTASTTNTSGCASSDCRTPSSFGIAD